MITTLRSNRTVGWALLPLRLFLGGTFFYAGLQKIADRHFFDSHDPASIQGQMQAMAKTGPVHALVGPLTHVAALVGLLIIVAELAVGLGLILGLWTRVAAAGGMLIALMFFLTVSWDTDPFYYGADIVFLFACVPIVLGGSGDYLSLDGYLRDRARREMHIPEFGPVEIEFASVRKLCGAYDHGACRNLHGRACASDVCPVLHTPLRLKREYVEELDRRTVLQKGTVAGGVAAAAVVTGGITALAGRLLAGPDSQVATAAGRPVQAGADGSDTTSTTAAPASTPPSAHGRTTTTTAPPIPPGTPVAAVSAVPVGTPVRVKNPATGTPAYVVQQTAGQFVALGAACTHRGCTVRPDGSGLHCPCHGAEFSLNGDVVHGPARDPLPKYSVVPGPDGQLYLQA